MKKCDMYDPTKLLGVRMTASGKSDAELKAIGTKRETHGRIVHSCQMKPNDVNTLRASNPQLLTPTSTTVYTHPCQKIPIKWKHKSKQPFLQEWGTTDISLWH
jgi:hypothetical protein